MSTLGQFIEKLICLTDVVTLDLIANFCFMQLVVYAGIDSNPADYISRSLTAMKALKDCGKENLLYKFAFCLTEKYPGTERPVLDFNRMPFGLIEYQLSFFSCTNMMQISVPHDFQLWYETMCAEFPTRFTRLFRGPMWSGVPKEQQKDPLTAKVNIAAPSARTVAKQTASSEFTTEPGLQLFSLVSPEELMVKESSD